MFGGIIIIISKGLIGLSLPFECILFINGFQKCFFQVVVIILTVVVLKTLLFLKNRGKTNVLPLHKTICKVPFFA